MATTQQQSNAISFTSLVATTGAAAGVAAFILLFWPGHRVWALGVALLILLVGIGATAWFGSVV